MENPNDIIEHLWNLGFDLDSAIKEIKEVSYKKAEAKHNYSVALAKEIVKLKMDKVPVTIINDVAKGTTEISLLKLELNKYEALFDVCKYNINSIFERISICQSILNWKKTEFNATNAIRK